MSVHVKLAVCTVYFALNRNKCSFYSGLKMCAVLTIIFHFLKLKIRRAMLQPNVIGHN